MEEEGAEQRSIQSVVIGFRLIAALEDAGGPVSLKDLAASADMPPGRAHAYLTSFRTVGMVVQDAGSGRYDLGPRALALGMAMLGRLDVRDVAMPVMREFRDETREAVHLSVWSGQAPVIIARLDGLHDVSMAIRLGFALPLERSATGRTFLAFHKAAGPPPRSLRPEIDRVREAGFAVTDGLLNAGFAAISVPIFNHMGELAAAMTTLGAAGHIDISPNGPLAMRLRAAGCTISASLGHRVPTSRS